MQNGRGKVAHRATEPSVYTGPMAGEHVSAESAEMQLFTVYGGCSQGSTHKEGDP